MKCNLVDVRKSDFINQETDDVVEGYIATMLVPSKDNKYPPNLIQFYVAEKSLHGHILREFLEKEKRKELTKLSGIAEFEVSYKYNKDKKLQKFKYLRQV